MSETTYPSSWLTVSLKELARAKMGKTILKPELTQTGLPVYSAGVTTEPWGYIEGCDVSYGSETIVISARGNIGMPKRPRHIPFVCTQTTIACSAYEPEIAGWLYWFLNQYDYSKKSSQTTIPMLRTSDVDSFQIPLPPLAEQKRIVAKIEELFSELDAGEESLRRARQQLGIYRQSLLKQAFEGKLTEHWRKQNPSLLESPEQLLKHIQAERQVRYKEQCKAWPFALKKWEKDGRKGKKPTNPKEPKFVAPIDPEIESKLPCLPNSWCWGTAEHTCDVVRGGSPRPAGSPTFYDGDIPFLKVADLTRVEGPYVDSFTSTIKEAGLQKTRYIEPPVLMISNSGATLGVPRICRIAATFNDGIAAFLDLPPETHAYYYYFWTSKTEALRNIDQGAAQPNLNTDLLKSYPIPLCSLPEQQEIVRLLDEQFTVIAQNEQEIDDALKRSTALRQSILKKAFTGQLVPQDPTDEPASVLLERICKEREEITKSSKKRAFRK